MGVLEPAFIGIPGQFQEDIPYGIIVGYGGPNVHPSSGSLTIAEIASFHQAGGGNLPQRKIIVEPSERTQEKMAQVMDQALRQVAKNIEGGHRV